VKNCEAVRAASTRLSWAFPISDGEKSLLPLIACPGTDGCPFVNSDTRPMRSHSARSSRAQALLHRAEVEQRQRTPGMQECGVWCRSRYRRKPCAGTPPPCACSATLANLIKARLRTEPSLYFGSFSSEKREETVLDRRY
jgi:hypothetical protein